MPWVLLFSINNFGSLSSGKSPEIAKKWWRPAKGFMWFNPEF